jgi:tryptophan synthase
MTHVPDRLRLQFQDAKAAGRPLFVGYITAGFPARADTVPVLLAMEAAGTGVIEIGVPFSDPLADGATIQAANEVALRNGITLEDCFACVREARAAGLTVPVLLMGYYNPILAYGEDLACRDAAAAGVDGFIVVDLPAEEAVPFVARCRQHRLSFVPLIAPTTAEERVATLAGLADSFLYCVSVMGTTGGRSVAMEALPAFLQRVRRHTDLPLAVGFGITRPEHVQAVGKLAEAVVVGTAIINAAAAGGPGEAASAVRAFVAEMTGSSPEPA